MWDFIEQYKAQLKMGFPYEKILKAFTQMLENKGVVNPSMSVGPVKGKGFFGREIGTYILINGAVDGKDISFHRRDFFKYGRIKALEVESISSEMVTAPVAQDFCNGQRTYEVNGNFLHMLNYGPSETYATARNLIELADDVSEDLANILRDPLGHILVERDVFAGGAPSVEDPKKSNEDELEYS